MSKHTPGPWFVADWTCFDGGAPLTVEAREEAGQSIWPDGIRKMKVASTDDGSFERLINLANARLIAAAPEMYELISGLSQAYDDRQSGHELASRLYDLRCVALRLLAKIEGGEV